DRQIRLDVRLAQEGEHLTPGEVLDHLAVALFHHPLKVATHVQHTVWLAAFHHRALDRGEPVAEHAHDQIVKHVGLSFDRPATVVLAHQRDDPVGDLRQQLATDKLLRPWRSFAAGAHVPPSDAWPCALITDVADASRVPRGSTE